MSAFECQPDSEFPVSVLIQFVSAVETRLLLRTRQRQRWKIWLSLWSGIVKFYRFSFIVSVYKLLSISIYNSVSKSAPCATVRLSYRPTIRFFRQPLSRNSCNFVHR